MSKIIGNTTATPNPRTNWEQTDATKADYLLNKPEALPNPYKLIITGGATAEYNGSSEITVEIPRYTLSNVDEVINELLTQSNISEKVYSGTNIFVEANGTYLTDGDSSIVANSKYLLVIDNEIDVAIASENNLMTFNNTNAIIGLYSGTTKLWIYSSDRIGKTISNITLFRIINTQIDVSKGIVINSSTEGSNKQFKITVDDAGVISATEIIN